MDGPKNRARGSAFKYGPAVRIGIAVLVLHTVGWLGWKAVNQGAESKEAAANAKHEQLKAALAEK
ncbi:uncharacterized protein LOC108094068 [Drosophila ficusphila]|uniref:uncharacterized protein LOC108094068 n=1 Tax=Drosophila ficusphila TaxID=30025 RepID=UPI0007E61A2B|nr:uncharacterized protein LOC108094068 [Drosophila ficusphila]